MPNPLRVLFLSRRNTVRSLMAEAILNQIGKGRFIARSAGVQDAVEPDPLAFAALAKAGYAVEGLRPKSVGELMTAEDAPLDFVFTLSDTARGEAQPQWPGHPISAHWSCEDPVLVEGDEMGRALVYGRVLAGLERRLKILIELPFESLDRHSLQRHVDDIAGRHEDA